MRPAAAGGSCFLVSSHSGAVCSCGWCCAEKSARGCNMGCGCWLRCGCSFRFRSGESPASVMNYVPEQADGCRHWSRRPLRCSGRRHRRQSLTAQPAAASAAFTDEAPGSADRRRQMAMQAQQTQQSGSTAGMRRKRRPASLPILHICYMLWGTGECAGAGIVLLAQNRGAFRKTPAKTACGWRFPACPDSGLQDRNAAVRRACLGCSARQFICTPQALG